MKGDRDHMDYLCDDWAQQRRIIMGIVLGTKLEPRERLGKLRSTLGQVREDGEGASQGGTFNQNFPEVYTGMSLVIHRGFSAMPGDRREVMDLHYVWRELPVKIKAEAIRISPALYWTRVALVKEFLYGFLQLDEEKPPRPVKLSREYKPTPAAVDLLRTESK